MSRNMCKVCPKMGIAKTGVGQMKLDLAISANNKIYSMFAHPCYL